SLKPITELLARNGGGSCADTTNQQILNESDLRGYPGRTVYTELLYKRSLMELSVGKSQNSNTAQKITYDYNDGNGKYDSINDSLTNDFENKYGYVNAGFRVRTQKKKYNYAIGVSWQQAGLEGKIIS